MKKSKLIFALAAALISLLLTSSTLMAEAENVIKYSCSNQIYQAFEKQKIDAFYDKTGIRVDVVVSSSGSAVHRLMRNFSHIASTARKLNIRGNRSEYRQFSVGRDPIAIIVHSECGVDDIQENQLRDIFVGKISNWKEIGGADLPIAVVIPGADSAAYKNFSEQVMRNESIDYNFMAHDSTMALEAVKHFPCGTVSFITRGAVVNDPDIQTIRIDGRLPSEREYPYFQEFYYITKGQPNQLVQSFIDFTFSEEGRNIMQQRGIIPLGP